jgi:DNA-directed RNA polymerase subunit M
LEFCPDCGTRMIRSKEVLARTITLIFLCPKCGNKKEYTPSNSFIPKIVNHPKKNMVIIGKKEQRLRTEPIIRINCPSCGNKTSFTWMVHGRSEQSSTQFFRCTKCNHTFRDSS